MQAGGFAGETLFSKHKNLLKFSANSFLNSGMTYTSRRWEISVSKPICHLNLPGALLGTGKCPLNSTSLWLRWRE
jgi:hypothetical protein